MSFSIQTPFPLFIYKTKILDNELSLIQKTVNEYITNTPSDFSPSWNCPTLSNIEIENHILYNFPILNNILKKSTQEYYEKWKFKPSYLNLNNIWINISPPNSYQEVHQHLDYHTKNLFSGVLYVNTTPDSGDLVLLNPISDQMNLMLESPLNKSYTKFTPQNGTLILFPSWLNHYVGTNLSSINRISISFNIASKQNNNA